MKSLLAMLALTTALTLPQAAMAQPVTLTTALKDYGGSLWMAGGKSKYYEHLSGWYRATGGDNAQIDGITGASVGAGRQLKITLDLADALFDAGYTLHIDAAAEDMRDSPNEISVPLNRENAGKPVRGRRYISSFSYGM
jgi:hypothetical protein